jgi:polysaccharide export outer membrane protein
MTGCADESSFLIPEPDGTVEFAEIYHLGSGDVIKISVFEEPELSGEFQIDGANTVKIPLIGEIEAGGKTVREAAGTIEEELREGFLRNPQVSIEVVSFRPYYILGEVRSPGSYPFKEGINVLNAVAIAGGFTYRAENDRVKIVRPGSEDPRLLVTGVHTQIFPGDTIYVEEKIF